MNVWSSAMEILEEEFASEDQGQADELQSINLSEAQGDKRSSSIPMSSDRRKPRRCFPWPYITTISVSWARSRT